MPGGHVDGSCIAKYSKFPPEDRGTANEVMWTFGVNNVTQNNSYIQLLATLCELLPVLRDLRQTSTERFVKPAVVRDFSGREGVVTIGTALQPRDWVVQEVTSSCLFYRASPGNSSIPFLMALLYPHSKIKCHNRCSAIFH